MKRDRETEKQGKKRDPAKTRAARNTMDKYGVVKTTTMSFLYKSFSAKDNYCHLSSLYIERETGKKRHTTDHDLHCVLYIFIYIHTHIYIYIYIHI